ncbi:MAG: hypothetical protein EA359_08900 [Balneolaceae bacterium]|nr:MAG: hypothetical protein EA359_08900 [Balneolaceae bacterium]
MPALLHKNFVEQAFWGKIWATVGRFVENGVFSPERAKSQSPGQSEHSECKRTSPRESRGNQCPPSDGLIKAPDRIEGVIDRLRLEEKSAVLSHETACSFPVIFNMVLPAFG